MPSGTAVCSSSCGGHQGNGARGIEFERAIAFLECCSFDTLRQLRNAVMGRTLRPRMAEEVKAARV